MQRDQLIQLLDTAGAVDADATDRDVIEAGVAASARLIAWCESQQLVAAQTLASLGLPAEVVLARATRCNPRDAERVIARSDTAKAAPVFGDALAAGRIAGGHLDQLAASIRRLEPAQRDALMADTPRLVAVAAASTPDEFARMLRAEERRLATDDGMSRLERQRAAVRLRSRTDTESGMNIFTLTVDPVTGVLLHNKINAATEALFHTATPDGCPTDPLEKQSFLRAHAFLNLIEGQGIRLGRPEVVVVIDTTSPDPATGAPTVDWGLPVEIPHRVLLDLFDRADVHSVIVRNGIVLHAPGELDLGRTTRLANRAQRRALRATYATCAMPGCSVRFDQCKIHHVHWWRHSGRTDLANLLPVCSKHHHYIHNGGWEIHLAPDRKLSITQPNNTTMTTGPPKRRAA
ncbi:hypothetical protein BH10ACT2_BH10ACT2_24680 [soil metagenome]